MFGLFKKKSELDKLYEKHKKLMGEYHKLSHTDRTAADLKMAEADEVNKKIDELENLKSSS